MRRTERRGRARDANIASRRWSFRAASAESLATTRRSTAAGGQRESERERETKVEQAREEVEEVERAVAVEAQAVEEDGEEGRRRWRRRGSGGG